MSTSASAEKMKYGHQEPVGKACFLGFGASSRLASIHMSLSCEICAITCKYIGHCTRDSDIHIPSFRPV